MKMLFKDAISSRCPYFATSLIMKKLSSSTIKHSRLGRFEVYFQNQPEFHILKREIFGQACYYFESNTTQPKILDVGAHIGLSCLYFKKLYPGARITCLEPIASSFQLLERNILENRLDDVVCHQLALAPTAGRLTLHIDPTTAHWYSSTSILPGAWNSQQKTQPIQVTAATLARLIDQPIDLLKLDVEGAEQTILENGQAILPQIKQLLVEFHPGANQSLTSLVNLLKKRVK